MKKFKKKTKQNKTKQNCPALRNQVCILWQRSDEKVENVTVKGGRIGVFGGGGYSKSLGRHVPNRFQM